MKRRRKRKVRTTISIDEDIFMESGDYIYNLSAFVQECMKREIEKQKAKEEKQLRIMSNMTTIKKDIDLEPIPSQEEIERLRSLLK